MRLGVYYFGGWSGPLSNFHFDGLLSGAYADRQPLYGWRDDSTSTMRIQLSWARRMGIGFFNFLWYWRPERIEVEDPSLNTALGNYLALPDHQGVDFAITYTNHRPFAVPLKRWHEVVEGWVTDYFDHPDYVRIAGRPVVFIYASTAFFEQHGTDAGVNDALEELRTVAREHGLPGVFVVGGTYVNSDDWSYPPGEPTAGEGYEALTQYAYMGAWGNAAGEHPYADLAAGGRQSWDRMAEMSAHPYIPVVMAGLDPRPWNEKWGGQLLWYRRTPEEVAGLLRDALEWVERHPSMRVEPEPAPPIVLITSWNELGEGMYIVPTKGDGFSYGRAIASVLGVPWGQASDG
ncbi:MAG TPA: glycoside hydrolase family 99-like domain-containing protein [Actinomycetota bacterium]